jgi:mono/diheme cytochrome c family protein
MSNTENRGKVKGEGGRAAALRARLGARRVLFTFALFPFALSLAACRQDMQDQPRYEAYEQSKFFADGQASRPFVEGTVARGYLRDDPAFYQGRRAAGQQGGGAAGAQQQQQGAGGTTQNVLQTTSPNVQGANAGTQPGGEVNVRGNVGGRVGVPAGETQGAAAGREGLVNEFPFQITKADLDRGQDRFQAFCLMCHGATGYGDGMIVRRGFRRPPSFHDDRLRSEPLGHFFDVITNGWGAMASYSDMIPPDDRWRIIAYIRALQLSQNAPAAGAVAPTPTQQPRSTNAQHAGGGVNR